jgi:acyl-coenzyme A thioesterase PaaI-like protein
VRLLPTSNFAWQTSPMTSAPGVAPDFEAIKAGLSEAVPFSRTLGVEYLELSAERAVLRLPDRADLHNHVGGPHAGAMFTLGESATGAVVIGSFADLLASYTPLAAGAQIRYRALAMGPVTAEAKLARPGADVRADLETDGKARFDVEVVIRDESGTTTGEMTVTWALRPHAR